MPKVSICVPTYNRSKLLKRTIEAVLKQTFSDLELIICDDASPDDTEKVVRSYTDSRIRYHRNNHNLGLYENWNTSLKFASGEYIAIYHDHDLYLPTIVEQSVDMLDKYPTASFVHTALYMIDEDEQPVAIDIRPFDQLTSGRNFMRSLTKSWSSPIMAATVMARREAYEQVGLRYEYQRYGQSCDLNMWFRLAQVGDVAYIATPQAHIRMRTKGQATAQFRWSNLLGNLRMREDHIQAAYRNDLLGYFLAKSQFIFDKDLRLSTLFIRSLLKEDVSVVAEGRQIIKRECIPITRIFLSTIASSNWLQRILENTILPLHYWRVRRWGEKQAAQVKTFQKRA